MGPRPAYLECCLVNDAFRPDLTDFGGGPSHPLLLLGPSLGTSASALWAAAAGNLTDRFHVVGFDLPGHGESRPATDLDVPGLASSVLAAVDALRGPTERFHYAGDSIGGAVGLQLLVAAPDRVASATLLCTGARIGEPALWRERASAVRAGGTAALVEGAPSRWFGPGFAQRQTGRAQALLDALAAADDASYAALCEALADFDLRARLAEIATPVLAVAGSHDVPTPTVGLRHIAGGVQHGRLVELDGVGHLAPAERPDEVARLIAEHAGLEVRTTTTAAVRAAGDRVRREVLGDAHVDRSSGNADGFTAEFQEMITSHAWGSVWTRPGLDRRSRSLVTLSALVAGGHHDELVLHLRGARNNGLTDDEIKELLLQTAIYCGVPAANTAFRIARTVLTELDAATTTDDQES
jgi:3-oxoadipate enol-lactonase/4-carboxymuconolactone decarboxylase